MDVEQIRQVMNDSGLYLMAMPGNKGVGASKRQYAFNYHDNSDEFKNLGSLHPDKRDNKYPS